jgi:hypothetical protein
VRRRLIEIAPPRQLNRYASFLSLTRKRPLGKTEFILAIVANIATIIIVFLAKRSFLFGKTLLTAGITKAKVTLRFDAKTTIASVKYIVFVFLGLIPIAYNSLWLYKFTRGGVLATRADALTIFFFAGTIVYWSWNIVSKFKRYSVADYLDDA